jgi:signal peptidase I
VIKNSYADIIVQGLEERGSVRTMFSGRSMAPTLVDGMTIQVYKIAPAVVLPADIILYNRAGQMVVHRVIGITNKDGKAVFLTKGDNQAYIDCDYVPEESLLGVVRGAFFKDEPQTNVLIDNKFVALSYSAIGLLVLAAMRARRYIPRPVRLVLSSIVGGFFFLFKKCIHATYLGIRYVQLFFRRYTGRLGPAV